MTDQTVVVPSSPADLKTIADAVDEIVDCMARIAAERDAIKDILAAVVEKVDVPKKYVRKLAKVQFADSYEKEVGEAEDFQELYEKVSKV